MDIENLSPYDLANSEKFNSLSPEDKTIVIEDLAKKMSPEKSAFFLETSNPFMESEARNQGVGRVYIENKVMDSLKSVLPTDYNDLDKDSKVAAIDKALPILDQRAAEIDPVNKNDTAFYARRQLTQEMRSILGEDVGEFGDKRNRFIGGLIQSVTAPFSEEGTTEFLARNLPTKPEYDQTNASVLTQAAGDFVGQIGMIIGAATAISATGGTAGVALAGSTALGLAQNSSRKFQENYNLAKADMGLSDDEALQAGIAGMPGAVIDSFGDALLLRGIKLGTVGKAFKSMTATEKAAEIVAKGGAILKDPKALRTFGANFIKGGLAEGVSESLGDAATAWGGYATSGHEGFKPSAESLWQSFWVGGLLGGTFNSIANTGKDMKNTRSLQELGKLDQAQFVALGEDAQNQIADLMDKENYTGALEVVKKFKSLVAPAPTQTPAATTTGSPEASKSPIQDPAEQKFAEGVEEIQKSEEELSKSYVFQDDVGAGTAKNLRVAPENPAIAGLKQTILSAVPVALNAVRSVLQISPETQGLPSGGQKVSLGELQSAIETLQQEKADAATKGKKQQSNQQQPPNADQGGQASQTGDSNSAQQGQAPQGEGQTLTPEQQLEAARNMTPEQRAEASASLRAKFDADQKLTPEQRAAKVKEGVVTEGEASPSFVITPNEAVVAQEEINKILAQIEKDKQDLADAKKKAEEKAKAKPAKKSTKKSAKKAEAAPQEDQAPQDQFAEEVESSRRWVTRRIDNMLMLAQYKVAIIPSFSQKFPTVQILASNLKSRVSNGNMDEISAVDKELNQFEADGRIVSKKDAAEMISFLQNRLNTSQAEAAQTGISNIQGAAQGGMLFQSDSGESFTSKNPKYKVLSELTAAELASAATIVKALQALGINDQVSDADKLLALEIKQAINSITYSDELISKLNEAAPSRAIFQNQVYALKGFGKTTKDTIMKHFDVMALNFLKTGNSLQAFWARVPDVVVVDSIPNAVGARGSITTYGTSGGQVVQDSGSKVLGQEIQDVAAIPEDETLVKVPFSSVPNRIVLVRGKYNASTMFHENDHNMIITGMAQQIVEAQEGGVELWDEVLTEVGAKRGDLWTVAQHEKWARAREAWINGGEVKSVFTRVFNALKTIFTNLYTSGALTKHRNPVLEKAFVKIYDIGSDQQYETGAKQSETPTEEEKNQIQRDDRTAFEPSREGVAYPLAKRGSRAIISAREQTIIAKLSEFDGYEAKLNWLSENGFLTLIDGETHINYKNRIMVLMRLGDLNLPFYISTGQAGKQNVPKNKWYFVFGIGKDGWINKGTEEQIANQFGYPILQKMANILDNGVGFIDYDQVPRYEGYAVFEINSRTNLGIEPASYAEFDPWNPDLIPPELTQYINNVNIALTAINKRTTEIGNSLLAERKAKDSLRDDVKAKVSRETGYEASKLLAHVQATKLEHAQRIIEAVKLNPDLGAAKAELIVLATTIEGDTQAFTDDEVFAMLGVLEQVYTGKQTPLGLPLYDEVDNHFAAVKGSNTYYGAVRQKGKPRDVQSTYESEQPKSSLDTVVQSDPIEIQDDAKQSESGQKYEIAIVASKPEMSNEMREAIIQKMRGLSPNQTPIQAFYELSTQEPVVFTEPETGVTVIDVTESTIVDSDGSQVSVRANETIAAQANKTLSEVNKKAYASFVGALNWTSEVASKFAKDFADFMMGAKFPSAISDIFSRFMVSMKSTLIAGASFFSMTNFVGQELTLSEPVVTQTEKAEVKKFSVINPQKIKDGTYIDSLIDIYAAPQAPRYDEKVDSVSVHDEIKNDAQIVDEFVRQTNDNEGKPYIIVSKREGLIRLYDASGNLIHKSTVLLGKSYGDVVTDRNRTMAQTRANDSLKITPSGRYETKTSKSRNYGEVVGLESYNTGTRNAIHRVCTKFESQKRLTRLAGELSNRISLGCVNVYPATSKKVNDLMRDGGVVYVTPDSQLTEEFVEGMRESRPQESASLFQDSSMETVVTPEQDQQYLALASDPVANREALQKMVDDTAKASGYNLGPFYHGTNSDFTVFDKGGRTGIYFTPDERLARAYGRKVLKVYAKITKGARTTTELTTMESTRKGYDALLNFLKDNDGLISLPTDGGSREVLLRDPNQIKSADPVTYDANGNIIPLSQRFNPQSDNILYQDSGTETVVTPEQDRKYLALASDPVANREALQNMVNDAAKDAGYDTKAWHGTIDDFDVFNMRYGRVMFYTKKELAEATAFGRASTTGDKSRARVMSVFLNTGKKFLGGRFTKKSEIGDSDSVITDNNVVVMFDPSRIKSAEPVTRDQSGNIIPLSKRFNPQSENILYQDSGMETVAQRDIIQEAIAPRTTNQLFQQDGAVEQRPTNFNSIVDIVQAIKGNRTDTPLKAVNKVIAESIEFRDRVKAESERRKQPRKAGVESIIERISRERSSGVIDTDTARGMISFVNSINPNLLEDTSISIRNRGRSAGTYDFVDNLVTLYKNKNGVTARTTSHEFWHGLSRYLPTDTLNEIKKDYVSDLNAYIKKNPSFLAFVGRYGLTQEEYDAYEFFASEADLKQLTKLSKLSPEGHAYSINFTKENYRFVMLDEYFAERMADLTESKNKPKGDTLISRMANLIREFLSIIKQSVSKDVYDNFYNAVMSDTARLDLQRLGSLDKPRKIFNPQRASDESASILYQFAGETAQRSQFLTDSLDTAKAMAAAGKTQEEIRAITGWFPSPYDGKMRWEIPDDKVEWIGPDSFAEMMVESNERKKPDKTSYYRFRLKDVISHKELFDAYPEAERIAFDIDENLKPLGQLKGNALKLWPTYDLSLSPKTKMKIILHEIQHWIQNKEGFAVGGSSDIIGRSNYYKLAGEIEARNIEARANLTPEQRAAIAPYSSENIAPEEAIVLFQAQESSGYSDSAIRGIIGMGHSMLQMAGRLNLKIDNNKIQKQINTLVNSQNNRSGKPVKGGTVQKAASALLKSFQEFHGNLDEADQGLLVKLAYEKSFAIEDAELDADSLARRNNVRKRKGQPIEEEQRVAIQEKVKTLYNTFRNARTRNFFKNRMEDQISPEFGKVADRILKLVNRGLDNVMGAFNSTNEDLLLRFAENIDAYNKNPYTGTPEFIEQFNDTVTEVEEAVMEHLVRQYYAYNSAYTDAEGITPEIDALIAQLPRMPEESAMEHYERTVKLINQIEAAMFSIAADGDPNGQSEKDKKAAKVRAKREKMAQTHQAALLEKFPTVDDFIAYQREKDGGVLTPEFEQILRDNYDNLVESQIEDLSDTDLRVYNSTALTMIVGGSNTQFLTLPKRQWREAKVASWHALVESMTDRVGQSPLVRSIYRSASRSNFLERQLNNFDRVFQANVENFHVWIDRFSQYAPVRNWFDRQFFADFQASVFTQAENARKAAESWSQETIDQYNDETDTTVDANPYLWVMSMLSQYNLGADPNKEFSKAVTRARTSIQRTIDQNRSARLVSEANRNLVALNYMMEGIDPEADNSYDLFMNNATVGNRIGAGNEAKAAKRLELLSNITNHFQQDIANQKFIRENIFGKPFQTVVNYLPLKALKVDGTLDEWDWTNIEPNAEYQQAAQNVNARSNEERADSLGQDRAYGMDFFNMVERKAVKNALDKHAILPVAILSDMFKTEEKIIDGVTYRVPKDNAIKTIFGSQPEVVGQLAIIKEKITHQMIQIYGATEPATGFVGGLRKALSVVQGSMLSGVGQIAQQSTAAVVDYAAREEGNIGYMIDAMIYWSKNYNKYRDWLLANNKDLYERGNTQGIREFERHVNNAGSELNSLLDKGWQGIDQIRKFMTISLRYGDKIGAELIFLAEHMKAVKQSGQMPTNGDYDISAYSNPYYTAQAQGQLAKFVGPSSAAGRSYWMSDHKQHYFLLRSLTGSFQSSAHNMSSQMLAAARNIVALQSDKSPEGKAERIAEYRKIGSIMAQQATFTGMRYLVGAMIGYAFVGAIKDAWDDEDGAIEEAQLALEAAKNKFYPSKAAKDMAVTMAERRLADAKSIRRSVTYMKQQASGDALFKSMVRDQLQNLHIVGSVGDGFVPKLFMMVPNSLAEQSHGDAQDLIISSLKKEKSEALAMGNRRKAAQISESILNAQAIEYIPYFYDKKDKSGFGGIVGGMLDPIFSSVKEGVEDMTRADKDFLTTRAFVPDMITYMAALGLGQADVNRIARQLQRMDDDLSKNRDEANERAGKEVDKLTNKSKTPFLR